MSENSLPLVTVIVPCYNHEKYVERCLDSIFRQTYPNFEVIVVDDVSSDNSVAVIESLQQKYNFKFIKHEKNLGLSRTLNEVIFDHANGKYIKCIASDDYLADNCLSVLVAGIQHNPNCAFISAKEQEFKIDEDGNITLMSIRGSPSSYEQMVFDLASTLGVRASSVLFRRDLCIEVGGFKPDSHIEDLDMWIKLSEKYDLLFVNQVVSFYQVVSNSGSLSKNMPKMYTSYVSIIADAFARRKDINYDLTLKMLDIIEKRRFNFIIYALEHYLKYDKVKACNSYFKYFTVLLSKRSKYVFVFWTKLIKSIFL